VEPLPPSHFLNPQAAEQAHPRPVVVCSEGQQRQPVRLEACLVTQAPQPRPRRQHPRRAHRYLVRPRELRLEAVCLAAPSPQGACSATLRPRRLGPRPPPGQQVSSAISLLRRLLPRPQALRVLQQVVFSGLQPPRLPRGPALRPCLATLAAVQCLVQLHLPLGPPVPRRLRRNRYLEEDLARLPRLVPPQPIHRNPPVVCLAAVSEPSRRLPQPAPVAYSARPLHLPLPPHNSNPATARQPARGVSSGPSPA
jgi:hypothetical protein